MAKFPTGFDYIRRMKDFFQPRTPATALKALKLGFVPPESFVYLMNNVKPLLEEPYDLQEIDRILARKDLDLSTALLLMEIFEKLIQSKDSETALFAAESINTIENRYNKKIFGLKAELEKMSSFEDTSVLRDQKTPIVRELAQLLFELGLLNRSRPVIKDFYLMESLRLLSHHWKSMKVELFDTLLAVKIEQELGHWKRALRIIRKNYRNGRRDAQLLYAWAEVEFSRGNAEKVSKILLKINRLLPNSKFKSALEFWWGRDLK